MTESTPDAPVSKRWRAGFFSSASSFSLPTGRQFERGEVRGYYIDMRVKAEASSWPPPWMPPPRERLHVASIQWGLGCYERYLAGDGEQWLQSARDCAEDLLALQQPDGHQAGGWVHGESFKHTFSVNPPWLSSMAQGEGASLLVRMFAETGEERYAQAARLALLPLDVDSREGGVAATLGDRRFPEEYPTDPPSFVLNGAIFTMWGLHDVGVGLGDREVLEGFQTAVDTLSTNLHRWDLGYWSRYDLFPHPAINVASSFYHDLHINQLRAMHTLAPREEIGATAERFAGYVASPANRRRAFARKALFRILVPRNSLFAHWHPSSPLRGRRAPA